MTKLEATIRVWWDEHTPLWSNFIAWLLRARWIVNSGGEMGIRVLGVNLFYYKYDTPIIYGAQGECSGWRPVFKREFGECVISKYPQTEWPQAKGGSGDAP